MFATPLAVNVSRLPVDDPVPSIVLTNARSIRKKIDDLRMRNDTFVSDFIVVVESWCTDEIHDDIINVRNMNIFREDRMYAKGGGILVYANAISNAKRIQSNIETPNNFECMWLLTYYQVLEFFVLFIFLILLWLIAVEVYHVILYCHLIISVLLCVFIFVW